MIHKLITEEIAREYHILDAPFKDFNDFFDQYADGKRSGKGIYQRYFGSWFDTTAFWKDEDEYPFAYANPKENYDEKGKYIGFSYNFYVRDMPA